MVGTCVQHGWRIRDALLPVWKIRVEEHDVPRVDGDRDKGHSSLCVAGYHAHVVRENALLVPSGSNLENNRGTHHHLAARKHNACLNNVRATLMSQQAPIESRVLLKQE